MRQGVRAAKKEQRLLHEGVQEQAERNNEMKSSEDMLRDEEYEKTRTELMSDFVYAIKVKYHEGASRIGSDIHGVMCDLAASETVELKQGEVKIIPLGVSMKLPYGDFRIVVPRSSTCLKHGIMMANSVGIIESEYCGDGDVWGFVAYAIRDTVIERGTRIAQFMPSPLAPDWDRIVFEEVESMGCADRGGYGSTGERSSEGHTAEGCTHREPSYGWKKLEEDARKRICDYAHAPRDDDGLVSCDGCRFHKPETGLNCIQNFGLDLVKRAKKLAGIEGEQ